MDQGPGAADRPGISRRARSRASSASRRGSAAASSSAPTTRSSPSTFDGPLAPVVSVPAGVNRVSFGPKGALLRASGGQRWMIEIPSGNLAPIAPVGLIDLASLGDGRAAAITEGARLSISTDKGERWADRTAELAGAPASVQVITDELWISNNGKAYKVEPGGGLKDFDRLPTAPPVKLRPRDPAWHGNESPLVAAVRRGARLDKVEHHRRRRRGARRGSRRGRSRCWRRAACRPNLPCEVMRAGDELLAVCAASRRPSLVVSGLLGDKGQRTEKTFPADGPFYANDDGTLAFGGSCDGVRMRLSVCTRDTHGEWVEHGVGTCRARRGHRRRPEPEDRRRRGRAAAQPRGGGALDPPGRARAPGDRRRQGARHLNPAARCGPSAGTRTSAKSGAIWPAQSRRPGARAR